MYHQIIFRADLFLFYFSTVVFYIDPIFSKAKGLLPTKSNRSLQFYLATRLKIWPPKPRVVPRAAP
jgi:hypothetical protein